MLLILIRMSFDYLTSYDNLNLQRAMILYHENIHTVSKNQFSGFAQDCVELFGGGTLLVVYVKKW